LCLIIVIELAVTVAWIQECGKKTHVSVTVNGVQKLISFLCIAREKLQRGTHPFHLYDKRTSYSAGLSIGTAISNTSHSNKAGSTTVKRAQLTGKGSRSTAVLP
jgi:hypothetical protein